MPNKLLHNYFSPRERGEKSVSRTLGNEMKWMITSALAAGVNVVIMLMFAASKLGPTPPFLPLLLAVVALVALIGSIVSVILGKTRHQEFRVFHLVAVAPWATAIGFNLWAFQGILYVT